MAAIKIVLAIVIFCWAMSAFDTHIHKCTNCGARADIDRHGYNHKYRHCDECGFCTYKNNDTCTVQPPQDHDI